MKTLLLVYNADSGTLNAAIDALHKIVAPESYPCRLCAITYGPLTMKRAWRAFLNELDMNVVFLHRDEYLGGDHLEGVSLPVILLRSKSGQDEVLVSAEEMERASTVDDLISMLRDRLPSQSV